VVNRLKAGNGGTETQALDYATLAQIESRPGRVKKKWKAAMGRKEFTIT
jgi:hypothetical protein